MTKPKVHGWLTISISSVCPITMCGKKAPYIEHHSSRKDFIKYAIFKRYKCTSPFNSDITCLKCLAVIEKHKLMMEKVK